MKLFSKRETCCICKKERICAGLLGLTNDPSGKQKLIPDDLPKGKKERLIRAYRHHAESYACEECARKEGRNPSFLLASPQRAFSGARYPRREGEVLYAFYAT